jgi:hypothetical protein
MKIPTTARGPRSTCSQVTSHKSQARSCTYTLCVEARGTRHDGGRNSSASATRNSQLERNPARVPPLPPPPAPSPHAPRTVRVTCHRRTATRHTHTHQPRHHHHHHVPRAYYRPDSLDYRLQGIAPPIGRRSSIGGERGGAASGDGGGERGAGSGGKEAALKEKLSEKAEGRRPSNGPVVRHLLFYCLLLTATGI